MKNAFFCISLLLCIVKYNTSCYDSKNISKPSKEGRAIIHQIDNFYDPLFTVKDYAYNIWCSDSSVIYEFAEVYYNMEPDSNSEPPVLRTRKYIYYNLKNDHCQDYLRFDTSAKPVANYILTPKDLLLKRYVQPFQLPWMKAPFGLMADTIIENNTFKRLRFDQKEADTHWQIIVYLSKQYSQNLFHLNVLLDKKYNPMRVMRIDWILNGELQMFSYYEELNNKLNENEKAIFKRWKLNADTTTLPVITFMDALKIKPYGE